MLALVWLPSWPFRILNINPAKLLERRQSYVTAPFLFRCPQSTSSTILSSNARCIGYAPPFSLRQNLILPGGRLGCEMSRYFYR